MKLAEDLSIKREILHFYLPSSFQCAQTKNELLRIDLSQYSELSWKKKPLDLTQIEFLKSPHINSSQKSLEIQLDVSKKELSTLIEKLKQFITTIALENPTHPLFWGEENIQLNWGNAQNSSDYQKALEEKLVIQDKKSFEVDHLSSKGPYLISTDKRTILDASSLLSTGSIGTNHSLKNTIALRPEIFSADFDLNKWDVKEALEFLMKEESQLPYIQFLNSGAEAIETGLLSCLEQYPDRKKIIAFEGSFHGRSALSIHTTHNLKKRKPFDFLSENIEYHKFPDIPEYRNGEKSFEEPKPWISLWSKSHENYFENELKALTENTNDPILSRECEILKALRASFLKEKPLAVIIEPMQSEGGDRYASSRFFRALRCLTRSFDVPLVFDEVQTGIGLGGSFFWFQKFNLVHVDRSLDPPDVVCTAKKAQTGICMSRFALKDSIHTSAASLMRGYIQCIEILLSKPELTQSKTWMFLESFERMIPNTHFQNPRAQGFAFSFDLQDKKAFQDLLDMRFSEGLLFFPAGDSSLRFRLPTDLDDQALFEIFYKLYVCLSQIVKLPDLSLWIESLPAPFCHMMMRKSIQTKKSSFLPQWLPQSLNEFESLSHQDWSKCFSFLATTFPFLIESQNNIDLNQLNQMSTQDLWTHYLDTESFTYLDLLWNGSRRLSYHFQRYDSKQIKTIFKEIEILEEAAYEPVRRDDPELFYELSKDPKTIFLAAFSEDQELAGLSCACPIKHFENKYEQITLDPLLNEPGILYSADLSFHPKFQGKGLGIRMKAEQMIAATQQGSRMIRSRNRVPEAFPMVQLNRKLSSVVVSKNHYAYEGEATAFYQSISLPKFSQQSHSQIYSWIKNQGVIKNKLPLCIFASRDFYRNLHLLKYFYPKELRHFYFTSSHAELIDKTIRILRLKNQKATLAFSFEGDHFATTTAASRGLGKSDLPTYFQWPKLKWNSDFKEIKKQIDTQLKQHGTDQYLGLFIKISQDKSEDTLEELLQYCKKQGIFVVFDTTDHPTSLLPDAMLSYGRNQIGVIATKQTLFHHDSPSVFISTWDGDEFSFNLMLERWIQCYLLN